MAWGSEATCVPRRCLAHLCAFEILLEILPPQPSKTALTEAFAPDNPCGFPSSILRGMSRPHFAALHLAAGYSGGAAVCAGRVGGPGDALPRRWGRKCRLKFLSAEFFHLIAPQDVLLHHPSLAAMDFELFL